MYLTDFHVHSDVSQDCTASMWEMVCAEAAMGVQTMCFTNHCDMVNWRTLEFNPRCRDIVPESLQKLAALQAEHPLPIEVLVGIELAESELQPEAAVAISQTEGLDFVLGSLHIISEVGDFYCGKYHSLAQCDALFDRYMDELLKIAELGCFDVMAHIGYCRRYMFRRDGVDAALTLEKFGDKIRQLLRKLIDKGKGIEINCSGLRDGCGPFPDVPILRLYRAMGGELITVGSDAHTPETAAKCVREGHELLKECGFDYVTIFRQRKPEQIKL